MIKKKIKMDLSISNAPQVVYAVQGDTNTRNVVIDLYNAGAAWTVPDGASGVVKFQKADGKGGIYDKLPNGFPAVVYEENSNQIEVSLAPQVLTCPGEVKAQVSLIYDNNIISTFSFVVLVQADPSANAEKSTDYVNWDRYFIPQTSGASVGQYLKIAKVDDLGRVIEVSPIDAPSGSGAIDGELDMKSNSILNVGTVEFWNDDELAAVVIQSEFPEGNNESENFNGVIEFRTSRGDEPVVIRNVADANNPNEAVNRKQLDESMDHSKLSNRDAVDQHPIEAITGLREILDEVKADSGGNADQSGGGLTSAVKNALLNCFAHVAWTDENGQSYYDALATALNSSGGDSGDDDSGEEGGSTVVTLTSISAVYGGGDVASGTALSELTDIVVTAHYSDGSTKNITNFELSGVIAEGSNTITVSYGGMVTTFEVVGTSTVRVYLNLDCTFSNADKATVYSDDGENTSPISAAGHLGYLANRTFEDDVDIHFRIVWGDTTVWRNLLLLSVVPMALETGKQNMDLNGGTVYRRTSLKDYYVEGDGDGYTYAGNVYEGVYSLKAGCMFAIGHLNNVTSVMYNAEDSYFYVEE